MLPIRTAEENGKYCYIVRYDNDNGEIEEFKSSPVYESELSAFDAGVNHLNKILN